MIQTCEYTGRTVHVGAALHHGEQLAIELQFTDRSRSVCVWVTAPRAKLYRKARGTPELASVPRDAWRTIAREFEL